MFVYSWGRNCSWHERETMLRCSKFREGDDGNDSVVNSGAIIRASRWGRGYRRKWEVPVSGSSLSAISYWWVCCDVLNKWRIKPLGRISIFLTKNMYGQKAFTHEIERAWNHFLWENVCQNGFICVRLICKDNNCSYRSVHRPRLRYCIPTEPARIVISTTDLISCQSLMRVWTSPEWNWTSIIFWAYIRNIMAYNKSDDRIQIYTNWDVVGQITTTHFQPQYI